MDVNPENQAQFRRSPLLEAAGFRHAFFTRTGGVSSAPYATLNFSRAVGDTEENVRANLSRAAVALGVDRSRIYFLSQVHGSEVVVVDGTEDPSDVLYRDGDAVLSTAPGVVCGVRVADCVPILVGERKTGAAVAIHAGWRGTVCGVIPAALDRVKTLAGSDARFVAAIGPHIGPMAFEVGEDVAREIVASSPDPDVIHRAAGERPRVHLARVVRAQLEAAGVLPEDIDQVPGCTVSDPDLFSFRRDGKRSGRHLAAIVVRGSLTGTRA
jgi:YfiH family protein